MARYSIVLDPWPGEVGFTVTVPALPGCVTQGHSQEEALERAREAIRAHLEGLVADGLPIPEERERPILVEVDV